MIYDFRITLIFSDTDNICDDMLQNANAKNKEGELVDMFGALHKLDSQGYYVSDVILNSYTSFDKLRSELGVGAEVMRKKVKSQGDLKDAAVLCLDISKLIVELGESHSIEAMNYTLIGAYYERLAKEYLEDSQKPENTLVEHRVLGEKLIITQRL